MTVKFVPREVWEAYEKRSGFYGLGEFLEQEGLIKLIEGEITCRNAGK